MSYKPSETLVARGTEVLTLMQGAIADKGFNTAEVYLAVRALAYACEKQLPELRELFENVDIKIAELEKNSAGTH